MVKSFGPTIVWIHSDSGDGKTTFVRRLKLSPISTDLIFIDNYDYFNKYYPQICECWKDEANIYDGDRVVGNLQIGQFWIDLCEASLDDLMIEIMFDIYKFNDRVIWMEGWVPETFKDKFVDRLKERGCRVWLMRRV